MADMLRFVDIHCPYCGEGFAIAVDGSAGDQRYVEDCQICCRPIALAVRWDEAREPHVVAASDDDA